MKLNHNFSESPFFQDLQDTWSFQLGRINKLMFRNGNHLMQKAEIPLQMEQIPVLVIVCAKKELSQQEIADILGRDKSSVQRTIVILEKKGFVKVFQDDHDKRKNVVLPTKNAYSLVEKIKNIVKQVEKEILKVFSVEDRDATLKTFKAIADKLEEKVK